ncbi:MAG TPA: methyl-accepting chemotaxis protein [Longimicrobium sp.]|nr:methyl-accepting chemotaxis protein [Longimicrobium sp.]
MRNFSIRTRLLAFGALGVALVLVVGVAGFAGLGKVGGAIGELTANTTRLRLQGDVDMMHDAIRADVYGALLSADRVATARAEFDEHVQLMRRALAGGLEHAPGAEARAEVEAAGGVLDRYVADGDAILRLAATDRAAAMARVPAFQQSFEALGEQLAAVTDRLEGNAARAQADAAATRRLAIGVMALATGLALVLMLLFAGVMTRNIVGPLREAVDVNRRLSEGDLTARAEARGTDEVGAMITSLNEMAARLRTTIGRIGALSGSLAESSTEISAGAAETAGLVTQLNVAIDQITMGAQEQAQAAQNTAMVMDDMSRAIEAVAADARAVAASAEGSVATARAGGETIQRAIGSMDEIRAAVDEAEARARELDQRAVEIVEIVGRVEDIAAQTNLLALNAAIEAARAGHEGRGFAVVADEVRKLAEMTSRFTGEIAARVADLQGGAARVSAAMVSGTRSVAAGTALAREAGGALGGMLQSLEATNAQAQGISESAARMTHQLGQVNELVESVAGVAQESAAAAEEMAAQSAEVFAAVQRIGAVSDAEGGGTGSVHNLTRMAQQLRLAVAGFHA